MKEYVVHYHLFDQKDELRTMLIKANTKQDAIVIFNLQCAKAYPLVKINEK